MLSNLAMTESPVAEACTGIGLSDIEKPPLKFVRLLHQVRRNLDDYQIHATPPVESSTVPAWSTRWSRNKTLAKLICQEQGGHSLIILGDLFPSNRATYYI